jgi:hypothetical protein
MKTIFAIAIVAVCAGRAEAWDGPGMWYRAANDDNPGGGGILGTGGRHDHGITCRDCHVERRDEPALALAFAFNPPLANNTYVPNQRYTVTATMTGAQLGRPCGMQYTMNTDNFAASFEDDNGAPAGVVWSDSQAAGSCPVDPPPPTDPGTTAVAGDCHVIFSKGNPDTDVWTFTWTAPASGTVHMFYGGVDGDCDMMSMGDATVVDTKTLTPMAFARPNPAMLAVAAALGAPVIRLLVWE